MEGCEACVKRDEKHLCVWDPPPSRSAPEPPTADFIAQFNRMQRRLASLEQQISSTGPLPQLSSAQSSTPLPNPSAEFDLASLLPVPATSQAGQDYTLPSFAPLPPSLAPLTPPYDPSDAEAERAAHELENLALGRSQYGSLGRNTQLPCIGQMSTRTVVRSRRERSVTPRTNLTRFDRLMSSQQHWFQVQGDSLPSFGPPRSA